MQCDDDGWFARVNDEETTPHLIHELPLSDINKVEIIGDVDLTYVSFGDVDQNSAPPVGHNVTFACGEGRVFDHDWFSTPSVMITCQVNTNDENYKLFASCLIEKPLTSAALTSERVVSQNSGHQSGSSQSTGLNQNLCQMA